ncbi:PhzF family phenazine biosynthesis protein, partial [bacterium]|nr:PhzF family phenazine biosynthesis protein [bacterium]
MKSLLYYLVDVFTDQPFGGNPLAVFPNADDLRQEEMQQIAQELNLSETTFLQKATSEGADCTVRIFTPKCEVPMAGHPTIGTAFVILERNLLESRKEGRLIFDLGIGPTKVDTRGLITMHQRVPEFGEVIDSVGVMKALGLANSDLLPNIPVQIVSVGVPFILVPIKSLEAVKRARLNLELLDQVCEDHGSREVMPFCLDAEMPSASAHSRMFAPRFGIIEDPATGSAQGPLAAYRVKYGRWKILFGDSGFAQQLSTRQIETGSAYSIRFDAALSPDNSFIPANAIVGGALLNGDFNGDSSLTDSRSFAETPNWFNLGGDQSQQATTLTGGLPGPNNSRNAAITDSGDRLFAIETGYTLTDGQILELSYSWRDAPGWEDTQDQIRVTIFTTSDDTPTGTRTDLESFLSGTSITDSTYQDFSTSFAPIPASADGKKLFVLIEGVDGNSSGNGTANLDNFLLSLFNPVLVGPNVRNGDFNEDDFIGDKRTFLETPFWTNLTGNQSYECTRTNILFDGTRCAVLRNSGTNTPIFANDTGYDLSTGDVLTVSFRWRDAFQWDDANDRAQTFIYTTSNNTLTGARTVLQTLTTPASINDNAFQLFTTNFSPIPASADGMRL